jgi:hypothetical protein
MRLPSPPAVAKREYLVLLLAIAGSALCSCAGDEPSEDAAPKLSPLVVWASPEILPEQLPQGVVVRRTLPSTPSALAWGTDRDLWFALDDSIGCIADVTSDGAIDRHELPPDEFDEPLEPSQVLAAAGPGGRVAVGLWNGLVAISDTREANVWTVLAISEEGASTGILPWVGWTQTGALTVHAHLTCETVGLNPDTGAGIWRRADGAARYPAASPNGRFLLLPWETGVAAEILDAATGKSLSSLPNPGKDRVYGAVDDEGRWSVLGRYGRQLTVWDARSGATAEVEMEGADARPVGLAFLPRSTICVVADLHSVALLDVLRRRWISRCSLPEQSEVLTFLPRGDLAVSGNGRYIAVRAAGPAIHVFEVKPVRD